MDFIEKAVSYTHNGATFNGVFMHPDAGHQRPLVLVAHAVYGRSSFELAAGRKLIDRGYAVFVMDVYGEGKEFATKEEGLKLMQPLINDRNTLRQRILAGYNTGKQQPDIDPGRIAAIGFCFGGLSALELARSGTPLAGVVGFHSLLEAANPPLPVNEIRTRLLILHGERDSLVSPEQVMAFQREMRESGADWEMVTYGLAGHAFTMPQAGTSDEGLRYHEQTCARAWRACFQFLEDVLA